MAVRHEPEELMCRRAFATAQEAFAGATERRVPGKLVVGWHDTGTHPLGGASAVVGLNAGYDDLLGEIVRVKLRQREVFVWVVAIRPVPVELSLSRRAFFPQLAPLTAESRRCTVEVVA